MKFAIIWSMQTEVEAKFWVNHDKVRAALLAAGAVNEQPMRLMRRVILDYPDGTLDQDHAWLRVRDEGNKVTITYKRDAENSFGSAQEIETTVGSIETTVALLEALGLEARSRQESKRETWRLGDVEIVLDEWPWLDEYIEIEAATQQEVKDVARQLGFTWDDAVFGSVTSLYKIQYPALTENGRFDEVQEVAFDQPVPDLFLKSNKEAKA